MTEASDPVSMTFGEYLEQGGESWFLTGKRQYAVQAMMVSKETSFHNELEVADYTVTNDGIVSHFQFGRYSQHFKELSFSPLHPLSFPRIDSTTLIPSFQYFSTVNPCYCFMIYICIDFRSSFRKFFENPRSSWISPIW